MHEDLRTEAALGIAKTAPPATIGFTAALGIIDWGLLLLVISTLFTVFQFYTSIRKWIDYKRDRRLKGLQHEGE